MINKRLPANHHFWLLLSGTFSLMIVGIAVSLRHFQQWAGSMWQACQSGWQYLLDNGLLSWQLVIPALLLVIFIKGGWSIIGQAQATRQLARLFYPFQQTPPAQILPFLKANGLTADDVVFLNLDAVHAFCLGFWQPRIWLTTGMVKLLSEQELTAVLAHEAHHCRQRDPLRLLVSRTLKSAFFFLPVVTDLAQTSEVQQEVAADQSAILQAGNNDLPLLSALHKILRQGSATNAAVAAYSPFSPTEARLRRLVYPSSSKINNQRKQLANWLLSAGVILMLGSTLFFSAPPPATSAHLSISPHNIGACNIELADTPDINYLSQLDYSLQ